MDPATTEWERLESFCATYGVSATVEVAPLYLTWLTEQGSDARAIARAVTALNAAASRRGEPSWSADEGVERWLRGFMRGEPFGRTGERGAPLYREHVLALTEACLAPTRQQRLQVAAVVLANETGLPAGALARLQWRHVRLRASSVEIAPPDFAKRGPRNSGPVTLDSTGGATCPVTLLRALRGGRSRFVLDGTGNFTTDGPRIGRYLKPLPTPASGGYRSRERLDTPALATLCARLLIPDPQPSRDLALITISHGTALRGHEAIALRQGHVQVSGQTLKITVHGRREPIYLPRQPHSPACPVQAWTQWEHHLMDQARTGDKQRAFLRVSGSNIWDRPMTPSGLNYVVDQRVGHAQLTGEFVYTSLRIGTIRGWIRDGRRDLLVARDAGLLSLASVERHERRETILSHSVAGMVGL